MKRIAAARRLGCRLLAMLSLLAAVCYAAGPDPLQPTVEALATEYASRVVQLRYFGGVDRPLGVSASPVTGMELGGGWVLTSAYGLEKSPAGIISVTPDGESTPLKLVARDFGRCVALLSTNNPAATPSPLEPPPSVRPGQTVVALGRSLASDRLTAHVGVVSAVNRLGGRAVQTDALVSPLNYGGPLITHAGDFVGLLAPLAPPGQAGVDLYDSGIGFAVEVEEINRRLPRLARGEDIRPGWLGAVIDDADPLRSPAKLVGVAPGGPAAMAGLTKGDLLVSLAGNDVPNAWRLRVVMSSLDAWDEVPYTVLRGEARIEGELTLSEEVKKAEGPAETSPESESPTPMKKPGEP